MDPHRRWWISGTEPLPAPHEARQQSMRAFPGWILRIECDRCGKLVMRHESQMTDRQRTTVLHVLLSRMRHDGCGASRSCCARAE